MKLVFFSKQSVNVEDLVQSSEANSQLIFFFLIEIVNIYSMQIFLYYIQENKKEDCGFKLRIEGRPCLI